MSGRTRGAAPDGGPASPWPSPATASVFPASPRPERASPPGPSGTTEAPASSADAAGSAPAGGSAGPASSGPVGPLDGETPAARPRSLAAKAPVPHVADQDPLPAKDRGREGAQAPRRDRSGSPLSIRPASGRRLEPTSSSAPTGRAGPPDEGRPRRPRHRRGGAGSAENLVRVFAPSGGAAGPRRAPPRKTECGAGVFRGPRWLRTSFSNHARTVSWPVIARTSPWRVARSGAPDSRRRKRSRTRFDCVPFA